MIQEKHRNFFSFKRGNGVLETPRIANWGPLGTPDTVHVNTTVLAELRLPGLPRVDVNLNNRADIRLPLGKHEIKWQASTLVAPLDLAFIYIPGLPGSSEKFLVIAAREAAELIIQIMVDVGVFQAGTTTASITTDSPSGTEFVPTTITTREVWVIDAVPPVITSSSGDQIIEVEGLEPGGASMKTQRQRLKAMLSYSDKCRDQLALELVEPTNFWPAVVVSDATWTVYDPGPNNQGQRNSDSVTQKIRVIDSIPPDVLAPPGRVTETGQPRAFVQIGAPRTFDFVDLAPELRLSFAPPAPKRWTAIRRWSWCTCFKPAC